MNKKAKGIIAVLVAAVIVLAGLCVYVTVDSGKKLEKAEAKYDQVIKDYKLYKNIISQDEVEKTLFGQPISKERNGEYRIGIKTATDGDFHAELTVYQAKDGKYNKLFSCEALVGENGPGKQSEGDTKSGIRY